MCGIFGVVSNNLISKDRLPKVSQVIRHRGPDDAGYLLFDAKAGKYQSTRGIDTIPEIKLPEIADTSDQYTGAFIHRRLSILDLSPSGHQPMSHADGAYWIVFNGEVYNYLELREELKAKGHEFKSTSDTEVILAAYQEWGVDCTQRFNGMWAMAIWDVQNGEIFLSRDRFGIKPLYYYHQNGTFIFASEVKAIREYLSGGLTLDERQLHRFMVEGQMIVAEVEGYMYKEIKQVLPGRQLLFKDNQVTLERYYEIPIKANTQSFEENMEQLRELFLQSIKYRLRSDVEVAATLSGGIDSSSMVGYASHQLNRKFNTFSAIWPGTSVDESRYIHEVNDMWDCQGHAFQPNLDDLWEVFDKEIWHQELPVPGSSLIAGWYVMKHVHDTGFKVVINGQGADETLAGYPKYQGAYINQVQQKQGWLGFLKYMTGLEQKSYFAKRVIKYRIHRHFRSIPSIPFPIAESFASKYDYKRSFLPYTYNDLQQMQKDDIEVSNMPTLLHLEDGNSMAHSVEARVPFLDHHLAEFALSVPLEQKVKGIRTKMILSEAMKDYMPKSVYDRRDKIGYATPIEDQIFITGSQQYDYIRSVIEKSELWNSGMIDQSQVQEKDLFRIYCLTKYIDIWG